MNSVVSVLICGIGGQGVKMLSCVIGRAAAASYPHVCQTSSRGLSQRGGAVCSEVRFGFRWPAPVLGKHRVQYILALDALEAIRNASCLDANGLLIANNRFEVPLHVKTKWEQHDEEYAHLEKWVLRNLSVGKKCIQIDLRGLAQTAGSEKVSNTVLLGLASTRLPLAAKALTSALSEYLEPQWHDLNLAAFNLGLTKGLSLSD